MDTNSKTKSWLWKIQPQLLIIDCDDDGTCWLPATCLIVICSYLSLVELYTFRFVNMDCLSAVNSYKQFRKHPEFNGKVCEHKVWNDCVRENKSSLCYVLKPSMKSTGLAFCS